LAQSSTEKNKKEQHKKQQYTA